MLKPAIHLCLVHNTATANVTPALDPDFRPQEVILLHSPDKEYRATCLERVLKSTGVKVSRWLIEDARNIEQIRERVLDLLVARENDDIALNASGGTRPMIIAAYEMFKEFNKPIFYVHPETDDVTWMHQRDIPGFNVADRIKLPAFLQAHGAEVSSQGERRGVPENLRRLTQELIQQVERLAKPLAALNWLAQQAETNLTSPPLTEGQRYWSELQVLIQQFAKEGLLTYREECLVFPNEEARFFVNGGWLEDYTYGLIFGLRKEIPKIQDIGRGIEVIRDSTGKPVKNELDVALLHNNHLHIIECKTRRFSTNRSTDTSLPDVDTPGTEILYKLDTLKGVFGDFYSKVMLVSYHPLSPWDRQRARDLGIETCTTQQLAGLKSVLRRWISANS
jgi:hypothetical protein